MYHQPHSGLPQPGSSFLQQAAYFLQQQQQFVVDDKPPQPSWDGISPPSAAGGLMLQAEARVTFSSIAAWAQEVCHLSEQAEKTGLMSALDYRRLQLLGYTILQHVALVGAAASATQTTPTTPATAPEVKVKKEKKRKDRSSTRGSEAATSKKRRKHEPATEEPTDATLVAEEQAHAAQPEGGAPLKTCAECGNWKTHQWRSGPKGMSTLCNACGMRFSRRQKKEVLAGGEATPVAKGARQGKIRRPRSPQCGHESDHSLSPVSSPLPGTPQPQLQQLPPYPRQQQHQQQPFDPRSFSVLAAAAASPVTETHHEKRSNLYTLLN